MNKKRNRTLSRVVLTLALVAGGPACLPDVEPPAQNDGGAVGGDAGPVDAGSDQGADADAEVDPVCDTEPPADCVGVALGEYCDGEGAPYECVVEDGCVIKNSLGECGLQEFCMEGACTPCPVVEGCAAVGEEVCTDSNETATCSRDPVTGCLTLEVEDSCPVATFCEDGSCLDCAQLGAACDVSSDTTRCDPEVDEGSSRVVESCVETNGCEVYVPDGQLECPLGSTCGGEGNCESCHDPLCEGIDVADVATQCLDPSDPRAIERCVADENGCLKQTPDQCPDATYCATDADSTSCLDCADLPSSCDTLGDTRCDDVANSIEVCRLDDTTGCPVWQVSQSCVDTTATFFSVCVPAGATNPITGAMVMTSACIDNECAAPGTESCSDVGDVETCTLDPATDLKYLVLTEDCSDRQTCEDEGASGKECVCDHACDMGDDECFTSTAPGTHSKVTQICDDTRADGCRVFVPDDSNPCNASKAVIPNTGGVSCDPNIGGESINRCVESAADMCRRPVSTECPCNGNIVCNRQKCGEIPMPYSNGALRYICE